jgi:carboxyl-terminal processing protease
MRELPHVTHLGETTAGAFSDAILRETYYGWAYTISVGDYRAADGESYEGVGLVPDAPASIRSSSTLLETPSFS